MNARKRAFGVMAFLLGLGVARLLAGEPIRSITLWNAAPLATGSVSRAVCLRDYDPRGYFSVYFAYQGTGRISRLEYELSADGRTYLAPFGLDATLATNLASGAYLFPLNVPLAPYIRLRATHVGSSSGAVSAILNLQ